MKRFLLAMVLAGASLGLASTASAHPPGYYRHPYRGCPYAGNYQPYGVYYRGYGPGPYAGPGPYVSPPWGWGYPPSIGFGVGVY